MDLHMQFINVNAVMLDGGEHIEQFSQLLKSLSRFKKDEREQVRASGIKLTTAYLEKFSE